MLRQVEKDRYLKKSKEKYKKNENCVVEDRGVVVLVYI